MNNKQDIQNIKIVDDVIYKPRKNSRSEEIKTNSKLFSERLASKSYSEHYNNTNKLKNHYKERYRYYKSEYLEIKKENKILHCNNEAHEIVNNILSDQLKSEREIIKSQQDMNESLIQIIKMLKTKKPLTKKEKGSMNQKTESNIIEKQKSKRLLKNKNRKDY